MQKLITTRHLIGLAIVLLLLCLVANGTNSNRVQAISASPTTNQAKLPLPTTTFNKLGASGPSKAPLNLTETVRNITGKVDYAPVQNNVKKSQTLVERLTVNRTAGFSGSNFFLTTVIPGSAQIQNIIFDMKEKLQKDEYSIGDEDPKTHLQSISIFHLPFVDYTNETIDIYIWTGDNTRRMPSYPITSTLYGNGPSGAEFANYSSTAYINMYGAANFSVSETAKDITQNTDSTGDLVLDKIHPNDQITLDSQLKDKSDANFIGKNMQYTMTIPENATINSVSIGTTVTTKYTVGAVNQNTHVKTVTFTGLGWARGQTRDFIINFQLPSTTINSFPADSSGSIVDPDGNTVTQSSPTVYLELATLPAPDLKLDIKLAVKSQTDADTSFTDNLVIPGDSLIVFRITITNNSEVGDQNIWYQPTLTNTLRSLVWQDGNNSLTNTFSDLAPGQTESFDATALVNGNGIETNQVNIQGDNYLGEPVILATNPVTVKYGSFETPALTFTEQLQNISNLPILSPEERIVGAKNGDILSYKIELQDTALNASVTNTNLLQMIPLNATVTHVSANGNPILDYQTQPMADDPDNQELSIPDIPINGNKITYVAVQIMTNYGFAKVGRTYTEAGQFTGTSGLGNPVSVSSNPLTITNFNPGELSFLVNNLDFGQIDLGKLTRPTMFDAQNLSSAIPLISVTDQRTEQTPISISVTQLGPFTNNENHMQSPLTTLSYTDIASSNEKPLTIGTPVSVVQIQPGKVKTNISFPTGKGIRLEQTPGATVEGNYTATLEWTITNSIN